MNGLIEFLTTEEMIVVYLLIGIASVLYFIIYFFDKTYYKRKQRQNTKELYKIVDEVVPVEEVKDNIPAEPVLIPVSDQQESMVSTMTAKIEQPTEAPIEILTNTAGALANEEKEELKEEQLEPVEELTPFVEPVIEEQSLDGEEELQYTNIEPDPTEAQAELMKLTETLEKAEAEVKNIELTAFEEEQEQNAIISLDELMKRGKVMYESGEFDKLEDEGNEPISLQDLEVRMQEMKEEQKVEPTTVLLSEEPVLTEIEPVSTEQLTLEDLNTVTIDKEVAVESTVEKKEVYSEQKKFKSSPVISPVYGIEHPKINPSSDIELENTANYEKLDEEIRKTNEFLITLRELQKKLD